MKIQTLTKLSVVSDDQNISLHFTDPEDSQWYICQVSSNNTEWLIASLEKALKNLKAKRKAKSNPFRE